MDPTFDKRGLTCGIGNDFLTLVHRMYCSGTTLSYSQILFDIQVTLKFLRTMVTDIVLEPSCINSVVFKSSQPPFLLNTA